MDCANLSMTPHASSTNSSPMSAYNARPVTTSQPTVCVFGCPIIAPRPTPKDSVSGVSQAISSTMVSATRKFPTARNGAQPHVSNALTSTTSRMVSATNTLTTAKTLTSLHSLASNATMATNYHSVAVSSTSKPTVFITIPSPPANVTPAKTHSTSTGSLPPMDNLTLA